MSFWVWHKRGQGLAFYGYSLFAVLLGTGFLPFHPISSAALSTAASSVCVVLWFASAFLLRRELMLFYASPEGGVLEIKPLWTVLFTVYYLNYCLWVVRDSA